MEPIRIKNQEGLDLSAYEFINVKNSKFIAIICHGFRGAKENAGKIFLFAERLNKLGIGVVAFDFAGSGASDGDFAGVTLSRQARDLQAVINYVGSHYELPLILLGRSFGGSTVLAGGCADDRICGYILWSTPVMLEETFARMLGDAYSQLKSGQTITIADEAGAFVLKPDMVEDFNRHNLDEYLHCLGDRPVLIVHGSADEAVDPVNARHILNQVANGQLFLVEGADHRFVNHIIARENITINWLNKNFINKSGVVV